MIAEVSRHILTKFTGATTTTRARATEYVCVREMMMCRAAAAVAVCEQVWRWNNKKNKIKKILTKRNEKNYRTK